MSDAPAPEAAATAYSSAPAAPAADPETKGVKRSREEEGAAPAPEPKRPEPEAVSGGPAGPAPAVGAADGGQQQPAAATLEPSTAKLVMVPDNMVGKIIGRQGCTIRQIQQISGGVMDIAKSCPPGIFEREVTVTGRPDQIAKCEELIFLKLDGGELPDLPAAPGDPEPTIVLIPDDQVGRIIGKGGSTIKELQEMSGANIAIAKVAAPGSDQREITLKGDITQIQYCTALIHTKLGNPDPNLAALALAAKANQVGRAAFASHAATSMPHMQGSYQGYRTPDQQQHHVQQQQQQQQQQQNPHQYQQAYQPYGQQPFQQPQYQQPQYQQRQQQQPVSPYGQQQPAYGQPPAAPPPAAAVPQVDPNHPYAAQWAAYYAQQAAAQAQAPPYQQHPAAAAAPAAPAAPAAAVLGGPIAMGAAGYEHVVDGDVLLRVIHAGEGSTMIEVPNEMVGRIIGKAGAAVKGIQTQSGASVDIPKDTGANSRYLTLVGNAQQMNTAQTLIIEKMEGVRADTYGTTYIEHHARGPRLAETGFR